MTVTNPVARAKRLGLFVMLIMGTTLHSISVWHIYQPALAKAWSFLRNMFRA